MKITDAAEGLSYDHFFENNSVISLYIYHRLVNSLTQKINI